MRWKNIVRDLLPPVLIRLLRPLPKGAVGLGYISAAETLAAAQAADLTVSEYVERLWNQQGRAAGIFQRLYEQGAVTSAVRSIVEIGPGTGRYLEAALRLCRPERHQVYETDKGWRDWLASTYHVEACEADGRSLKSTETSSVDLVHAHGVFVYVPFLVSYRYFQEIARVSVPGGFVVFDIISERCMEPEMAATWIKADHDFPCFLSSSYVKEFFERHGFHLCDAFLSKCDVGVSEYMVFQKWTEGH